MGVNYVVFGNKKTRVTVLTQSDGLTDNDITDLVIRDDKLWVGTRSGLCSILRSQIDLFTNEKLNLYLDWKEVLINNSIRDFEDLNLSYFENNIKLDFGACYFRNPNDLKFRYKWSK